MKEKLSILVPCFLLVLVNLGFTVFYPQAGDFAFWIHYTYAALILLALTALYFLYLGISNRKRVVGLISILLFLVLSISLTQITGKLLRLPVAFHSTVLMHLTLTFSIGIISYVTFKNRTLMLPILVLIAMLILGELSRRMHWPGASIEICIGYFGLFILYSIRLFLKTDKQPIDLIKWICVGVISLLSPIVSLHWTGSSAFNYSYFHYVKEPCIWALFLLLIVQLNLNESIRLNKQ